MGHDITLICTPVSSQIIPTIDITTESKSFDVFISHNRSIYSDFLISVVYTTIETYTHTIF